MRSLFIKLTIQLEGFTNIISVPLGAYFVAVSGDMHSVDEAIAVAIGGLTGGGLMMILTTFWRWFYFKKLENSFALLDSKKFSQENFAKLIKIKLLKYPFLESKIIVMRWLFGGVIAYSATFIAAGKVKYELLATYPLLMLLMIPLAYISFFYICEHTVRPLYKHPELKDITLEHDALPQFRIFKRITISLIAILILPMVILGYLLIGIVNHRIVIENPGMHIIAMTIFFSIPVGISAYLSARSIKNGLSELGSVLAELGKGNFNVISIPSSSDELGTQSFHLNLIIKRLNNLYSQLSALNQDLELKVEERTYELKNSLTRVENLKLQQDRDYYLTSMLLEPLKSNQISSKKFKINFLLKQKKVFDFKRKEYDIGGDLCVAHTISLQGRNYHAFVNSDAMGKSIQGAGGALVMGAVLQTILERTRLFMNYSNVSPERWLKNSFLELHRVFESFDGSMLVSMFFGLIDDESSFMYYINAEHPNSALFRDGKSAFLNTEQTYRKLGTQIQENRYIYIRTFQLHEGDILISGSDGRDDIAIQINENGTRVINEDEFLFLNVVEEARGDLNKIFELLNKIGELTDDLSLIHITFLNSKKTKPKNGHFFSHEIKDLINKRKYEEAISILEKNLANTHEPILSSKYLARMYYNIKDYSNAEKYFKIYISCNPSDTKAIYQASICARKNGNFQFAAELSDRVRLREPDNLNNLLNLFQCYQDMQKGIDARSILEHANMIYPDDPKVKFIIRKYSGI